MPTKRDIRSLWGRSGTEIYAAADSGTVLRYDGVAWRTLSAPTTRALYSLFGIPNSNAIAWVGDAGRIVEGQP